MQRKAAKERLAKAMAAPEEDREWIKEVNEHAGNAESLKLKVVNEKRPDVLSFRYDAGPHGYQLENVTSTTLTACRIRSVGREGGRVRTGHSEKMLRFAAVSADAAPK